MFKRATCSMPTETGGAAHHWDMRWVHHGGRAPHLEGGSRFKNLSADFCRGVMAGEALCSNSRFRSDIPQTRVSKSATNFLGTPYQITGRRAVVINQFTGHSEESARGRA